MAKLPMSLIANARTKSKELERILERRGADRRQRQNQASLLDADAETRVPTQHDDGESSNTPEEEKEHRTVLCSRLQRILQCATGDQAFEIFQELQSSNVA